MDAILSPSVSFGAPIAVVGEEGEAWLRTVRQITRYTFCWAFQGNPTLAVPVGFDADDMPLGMQNSTPWFDEATALGLGHAFQSGTSHLERTPGRDDPAEGQNQPLRRK